MDSMATNILDETLKTETYSMDVDMIDTGKHTSNLTMLFTHLKTETDMDAMNASDRSKLLDQGLSVVIADKLDDIFKTGKLTFADLDKHAIKTLKEFPTDGALEVLSEFAQSNVGNIWFKSAYLCGMLKKYIVNKETFTINPASATERLDEQNRNASGCSKDEKTYQEKHDGLPSDSKGSEGLKCRTSSKTMTKIQKNETKYPGKLGKEYFLVDKYRKEWHRMKELASTTEVQVEHLKSYIDVQAKYYKHFTNYYRLTRERDLKKLKELQAKLGC
ncbi:uncharacterized protein LOC135848138 isoform X2 [Planococcus citri]|uniref:uncharacterized protein LOC135848138 isoform X2 n=1 Tax=Planococcus citri TaxID=170843 RepID=UPI0031F742C9